MLKGVVWKSTSAVKGKKPRLGVSKSKWLGVAANDFEILWERWILRVVGITVIQNPCNFINSGVKTCLSSLQLSWRRLSCSLGYKYNWRNKYYIVLHIMIIWTKWRISNIWLKKTTKISIYYYLVAFGNTYPFKLEFWNIFNFWRIRFCKANPQDAVSGTPGTFGQCFGDDMS